MPAGVYNILAEQGANFSLHLQYSDAADLPIDMDQYTARMQVRKSAEKPNPLLFLTNLGLTGGGTASSGEFVVGGTGGVSGVGGLSLNTSKTGGSNHVGGILVEIDSETMSNCPHGNHFYDIEIINIETGAVTRLIQGRFTVDREVTR